MNLSVFEEAHSGIPLKEYIRKWSNWVIDFHWIFTLEYFIDFLPTNKLLFFIKNYPSLDNFILHWMWWSYTLSKDLERFTKDPFRAIGSTPWLCFDINTDNDNESPVILSIKNDTKIEDKTLNTTKELELNEENQEKVDQNIENLVDISFESKEKQSSMFFQYNEFTIKTICSLLFNKGNNDVKQNCDKKKITKYLNEILSRHCFSRKLTRSISCSNLDDIKSQMKSENRDRKNSESELKFKVSNLFQCFDIFILNEMSEYFIF